MRLTQRKTIRARLIEGKDYQGEPIYPALMWILLDICVNCCCWWLLLQYITYTIFVVEIPVPEIPVNCVSPGGTTLPVQILQFESNRWWLCSSVVSFNKSAMEDTDVLSSVVLDGLRSLCWGSIFVWKDTGSIVYISLHGSIILDKP